MVVTGLHRFSKFLNHGPSSSFEARGAGALSSASFPCKMGNDWLAVMPDDIMGCPICLFYLKCPYQKSQSDLSQWFAGL